MGKIKALFGFTVLVGLLAISVTPAFALFESELGKLTEGSGKAGKTEFTDGTATVSCASAKGTWKLPKATGSETVNILVKSSTEGAKKEGWEKCTSSIGTSVEISECELQEKQTTKKPGTATGAVVKGCEVKIPITGCVIKIPKSTHNEGPLKTISTSNSGTSLISKVAVEEIEAEAKGLTECPGVNKVKSTEGKEKGEVTAENLKEI